MDAIDQLKQDVRDGRIDANRLLDLVILQQRQLQAALQRIAELEKQLGSLTAPPTAKLAESFSLRAEEQRQQRRGKRKKAKPKPKKRRGRIRTADKIAQAERHEKVFPEGVPQKDCHLSHSRPVWRLEQGRAVLVAYDIYRGPRNQYGKVPGVLGRSEFSLDIVLAIAYMVYVVGLSFDKVCLMLDFFQGLHLRKAQADALMHQLARHWQEEFETLCTLLANSAVVHSDETSWSINSVWAFLSEKARLLFFGVHKDAATLEQILNPATFTGILISDDAAVYGNFTAAQKCWAHLLRKAIKLTLQEPQNEEYRQFADRLLEIYRQGCRIQRDGRLGDAGRLRGVAGLNEAVFVLCGPLWCANLPPGEGVADDYRLLNNEVMRLFLAEELFTFVTARATEQPNGQTQAVAGTNNEAERTLRGAAGARKTGRTSKTISGARRQSIVSSVLESLRVYLPKFTLKSVIEEVNGWRQAGESCFTKLLRKLKLESASKAAGSTLDRIYTPLTETG